jgi:hypothetical protein
VVDGLHHVFDPILQRQLGAAIDAGVGIEIVD